MPIDIEAIRRKVQQLSGIRTSSNIQMWKPQPGAYKVRTLPSPFVTDGQPFVERWFYYLGEQRGILAPHQFNKPDPINTLMRKLYSSGKPGDKELAKKLQPKSRVFIPIIVRGEEDKGVQIWSVGRVLHQKLLSYFLNEDVGDITDPLEGFDLDVKVSQVPGKKFFDTDAEAGRRPKPLSDDPALAKKWLDSIPNVDDMYQLKSPSEIEELLNAWLNEGDTSTSSSEPQLKVDDESSTVERKTAPKKEQVSQKKKQILSMDDDLPNGKKGLDEAFQDLMDD